MTRTTEPSPSVVIDTSALVAILPGEEQAPAVARAIAAASCRMMSAASAIEATVVAIARRGSALGVEHLIERAGIEVVPVTAAHVRLASEGHRRFGKGRQAAGLNFGDCFSYALARATGHPLLFTGNEFAKTVLAAVPLAG